jgi:hypothetical protein
MAGAVEDAAAAAAAAGPDKPKKRSSPDALDGTGSKAAKAPVDERAFVVNDSVKSLGQHVVRQQGGVASRISVVPGAASKLLCVITNDVLAAKRRMEENGNKELFIVSATLLQVFLRFAFAVPCCLTLFCAMRVLFRVCATMKDHGARGLSQRALRAGRARPDQEPQLHGQGRQAARLVQAGAAGAGNPALLFKVLYPRALTDPASNAVRYSARRSATASPRPRS